MRTLAVLLFLAAVVPATAQETADLATTITSFDPTEGITWSTTVTNAYSMLEWTPQLTGVWNPFVPPGGWVTGFVARVGNEGILSNLWNMVSSSPEPLFFRVRSSETEITNIVETTRVRVANRSGNVVSNLFLQVRDHGGWWVDDWSVPEIQPGQVLAILTDYDGALEDIPDWCHKTGNEFLGIFEDEDHYKFYIKKHPVKLQGVS